MTMTEQEKSPSIAPVGDVQRDLSALRNDVSRLTREVTDYLSKSGRQAARDASDQLEGAVRERPLMAIAIAMGVGLLCGAIFWRR